MSSQRPVLLVAEFVHLMLRAGLLVFHLSFVSALRDCLRAEL
ncbi:hypothetical protein A2U01_0094293 [Trifolium medium]|uniref:Uncharacterized protein n=1 Tax=Trifolium medium TaxID=97028 RepID=A0A392UHF8_9FABA|nr:hypothetical protein [Trifolium medium]